MYLNGDTYLKENGCSVEGGPVGMTRCKRDWNETAQDGTRVPHLVGSPKIAFANSILVNLLHLEAPFQHCMVFSASSFLAILVRAQPG